MDCSSPGSSFHGISQREYWSGLPFLQGIFLTQGLNPHLLCLLHWQVNFFTTAPPGNGKLNTSPLRWDNRGVFSSLSDSLAGLSPVAHGISLLPWHPVWLLLSCLSFPYQCFLDHLTSRHLALQTLSQGALEKLSLTCAGPSRTQAHGPQVLLALHGTLRRSP